MVKNKTILVAPLYWGLGHASRCIPVINALLAHGFKVIIASDGGALLLLQKEFPQLESIKLPSYNISYPKRGSNFKWALIFKLPQILKTIASEKKIIAKLVSERAISGIISDNRFGVRNQNVPSVFITHQLKVLSGKTTVFSSKLHQKFIKKFNECWVPDVAGAINLSGTLGHPKKLAFPVKYIGILSRMQQVETKKKYDILAILSGPEPQRTLLEEKLIATLQHSEKKVLLVQGKMSEIKDTRKIGAITIVNYMLSRSLERAINESEIIIARSGYSTIMDLATLEKKAFFIPTPGQYEQEYLAKKMQQQRIAPYCTQEDFLEEKLQKIIRYKGFNRFKNATDFESLFCLFQRK
jgi:predicted glycosyltransferase